MRSMQACATGLALALGCAAGCELVTGLTGDAKPLTTSGSGGGTTSSSIGTSSSSASSSSSSSSASGSGGPAKCTAPPCAFGQGCTADADCATAFCNQTTMTCDAKTIASGLDNPNSLVVDSTNLYWTDGQDGTVVQAVIATGAQTTLASGQMSPSALIMGDSSDLYWVETTAGNVDRWTQSGAQVFVSGQAGPVAVVRVVGQASEVVWMTQGTAPQNGAIMELPPQGPPAFTILTVSGPGGKLVYNGQFVVYSSAGTLFSADLGTAPKNGMLLSTNAAIAGIAADGVFAYWTDGMDTVAKVPIMTGSPVVLASQQAKPADVAVDGLYVYWINQGTTQGTGAVMKAPLSGGNPIVLALEQVAPRGLVLTSTDVYWISGANGQGAVKTVPK